MPARTRGVAAAATFALLAAGCAGSATGADQAAALTLSAADIEGTVALVHRNETCGCCGAYEDILEAEGFEVVQEMHDDVSPIKADFGIPTSEWSCHTTEIDGYAIEGHVPLEAIYELLSERPEIDGIALAGMPVGSPGMPGEQTEPFVVTTIVDGEVIGEFGSY